MTNVPGSAPDPRVFPDAGLAPPFSAALYLLAEASLGAGTGGQADALDAELRAALTLALADDGRRLAAVLAGAPSIAVARHLWRTLDAAWRAAGSQGDSGIALTVFALPVVIVVGSRAGEGDRQLSGVLPAPDALAALLMEHRALAGNRTFALGNALVATDAIDIARLPELLTWQRLPDTRGPGTPLPARVLVPVPLSFAAGRESVHLRFLVGSAIAAPGIDVTSDRSVGGWGMPLAQALSAQLATPEASVLALPKAPQSLLSAVWQGRVAQRDVAAQLFAGNAIRKLRAAVGEPSAVISAHRSTDAVQGGELRLSLSSPFEPREAEGFRCPLYPQDRVADVVTMLTDLLRDCRVADIRVIDGVHADRDAATGLPLLFKPENIPPSAAVAVH